MTELPLFLPLVAGAVLAALTRGWLRAALMLAAPVVGAWQLVGLEHGIYWQFEALGLVFTPTRVDQLSLLFGYLFHLAAFIATVYSLHHKDTLQHVSGLAYAGSAVGAAFAGDLLTLFVFWELAALTSVFLIWARRTNRAFHSGMRYLVIQVLSGVTLLTGVILHIRATGDTSFGYLGLDGTLANWLILAAFGIKCAFPLVHNWLTDAYPEATVTGTVFLSAFTTKLAVYALARGFPGTEMLVYVGAVMTCFPIFYAVIENDLRRVLGYSMINQIGFMVVGIGIGTQVALNGAVAHAFNDVIFKGLLMMSMGAVLYVTGRMNGSDLGGLYKKMPQTTALCIVGAASISAFPLFSGFVSKSMVMTAAVKEGYDVVWLALLFASAGVFHHAGIKIPFFAFFAHDAKLEAREPPLNMRIAMLIAAVLCVGIGCFPQYLYALLPYQTDYWPYDTTHVLAQLQILFFSAAAFAWLKLSGLYPPELRSTNIDVEWLYRRLGPAVLDRVGHAVRVADGTIRDAIMRQLRRLGRVLARHHGPSGVLATTWPTGSMVIWVAILLAVLIGARYF